MIFFYVMVALLAVAFALNYILGTFRLSTRTYVAMSIFFATLIVGTAQTKLIPSNVQTALLVISAVAFFTTYHFIANETSTDVEKMILDVQEMLRTGELPAASNSSLLTEVEKEKIDAVVQKMNDSSNERIAKKKMKKAKKTKSKKG